MDTPPDLDALARRYMDLWQEQLRLMASDPATAETLGRLLSSMQPGGAPANTEPQSGLPNPFAWLSAAGIAAPWPPTGGPTQSDAANAPAAPKPAPRSAPAAAAPDDSGDDLRELERRVAALEQRLAELEPAAGTKRSRPAKGSRKR